MLLCREGWETSRGLCFFPDGLIQFSQAIRLQLLNFAIPFELVPVQKHPTFEYIVVGSVQMMEIMYDIRGVQGASQNMTLLQKNPGHLEI